jgi:predicted transcriptional regulator
MNKKSPMASTPTLIADPAPTAMLTAMLDGRVLPAAELARVANVSAQSANMHLTQLVDLGFLKVWQEGRRRYYSLTKPDVALRGELLGSVTTPQRRQHRRANEELCYARTCYDHLAGKLGVQLNVALERKGLLVSRGELEYEVTPRGIDLLEQWQVDLNALHKSHRSFARRCLDGTERRPHLAGALGAAVCQKLLEFRWITRIEKSRAVRVSSTGRQEIARFLNDD